MTRSQSLTVVVDLRSPHEFFHFQPTHRDFLSARFPNIHFCVSQAGQPRQSCDVYFGWTFPPDIFARMPGLKWIASPSAGFDHLPIEAAERCGVTVTRSFGFHGVPMAQHAMAILLGFSRGLFLSQRLQTAMTWWKDDIARSVFDLEGETLTIVGCGHVGLALARLATAHGMQVIGCRRDPPAGDHGIIDWVTLKGLESALGRSVAVVNLLPATLETRGFFSPERFAALRRGATFINLGRASTVDRAGLLAALDDGQVGWCGLDVYDTKPPPMDDVLRFHPRVVLTPKSSVFTPRYMDNAVSFFADNLHRFVEGQDLLGHLVGPRRHP